MGADEAVQREIDRQRLAEVARSFAGKHILVVGDVMVDEFVWGKVSRISPEAPVPVVEVSRETSYPGGAANVARNLAEFTGGVSIMGLVGEDAGAAHLTGLLQRCGIAHGGLVREAGFQTIVKTRIIARSQQVVRVDREQRFVMPETLTNRLVEAFREQLRADPAIEAVILQDYAKGFFTQALADKLMELAHEAGKLVAVDPNPRSPIRWRGADVMKPNRSEALDAAEIDPETRATLQPALEDPGMREVAKRLLEKWDCRMLLVTLGEDGMALFAKDGDQIPPYLGDARAKEVFDVSGAGDTVIALFTLALAAGARPHEAVEIATHASGIVVGKIGTATVTPAELMEALAEG